MVYKSLNTIPIANFKELLKTGNLNYLRTGPFDEIDLHQPAPDNGAEILVNMIEQMDFIDNSFQRKLYEKEIAEFKYLISNDVVSKNRFNMLKAQLNKEIIEFNSQKESNNDFIKEVCELEAFLKMGIDIYKFPTNKYFAHRKRFINSIKNNK